MDKVQAQGPVCAAVEAAVEADPWQALRRYTDARIALGRSGISQPTAPQLAFQLAHAQARDAVHRALDAAALAGAAPLPALLLHSAAADRAVYLQRPDLGRRLDTASRLRLGENPTPATGYDLAFVVADGLSALAVEQHALPMLRAVLPLLRIDGWSLAPLSIVRQGRVALGDEVGQLLQARAVVVLIGERPGLSSPDSLGLYLSWGPRVGLHDASRNCISNVRPQGLSYEVAARKLHYLLTEARRRQLSGVALKDETACAAAPAGLRRNFLIGRD